MENQENFEQIFVDEQDMQEEPDKKSTWPKKIIVLTLVGLLVFSISNSSNSKTNSVDEYKSIIARSKTDFFENFSAGQVYSNVNIYFDETILPEERIRVQKNIDLALEYMHVPLSAKTVDLRIFDDYDALEKDMFENIPDGMIETVTYDLSPKGVFGNNPKCDVPGSVGATYDEGWIRPRIFILTECGWEQDENDVWQLTDPDVVAHELAHVAQDGWFNSDFYTWSCFVPKWFSEGQPQFVSAQIATLDSDFDYKYFRSLWIYWEPDGNVEEDEDYESSFGPYSDGAFAFEYLVGKYGWKKIETLVTKLNIFPVYECGTKDIHERFKKAFKTTYGISLSRFYEDVKPYIKWNIKNLE